MQHVEFIHQEHFDRNYYRKRPGSVLGKYIDFFWEIRFEHLYQTHPNGFSDALFPNVGFTYLINLGTPFVMQLGEDKFEMKSDGFLPRHKPMVCHHSTGNRIFGIKFRISPVSFQKKIDFSEYREYIFPLAYLIDRNVVEKIKSTISFDHRVDLVSDYYESIIQQYQGSLKQIDIVSEVLSSFGKKIAFDTTIEQLAAKFQISERTLHRYFEKATGVSGKHALQLLKIRKAVEQLTADASSFDYREFGYYDYSHFYKHLRQFLQHRSIELINPHLQLLKGATAIM